jgi:alcohol dehydrogenase
MPKARVVTIDITDEKLEFLKSVVAAATVKADKSINVAEAFREITGGAHVSIDAPGSSVTCFNSISNLRLRGKYIQVGLMEAADRNASLSVNLITARELEITGSRGRQAYKYEEMPAMNVGGKLQPQRLIGKTVCLEDSPQELAGMNDFSGMGVTVIDRF